MVRGGFTMKKITLILLLSFCFSPAHADVRPEHSGAWYNHDQAGHGLSIQVLNDERTIAFWFSYSPDGSPMFLVIDGVNDGHTVTGPAYYQEGMVWRQFDPATLSSEVWGEISIEFLGCNSAVLNWSSSMEGYGDGLIELERLTYLAGLECDEIGAELMGEWQVEFAESDGAVFQVVVDADGAFEFHDAQACLWEGHIHVQSMERGYLTGRFGSPTCPWAVPMLDAFGHYYANGVTFCSSGGSCISYDQALTLVSDWYEGRTIGLTFLR
jgi:hypothetical protein